MKELMIFIHSFINNRKLFDKFEGFLNLRPFITNYINNIKSFYYYSDYNMIQNDQIKYNVDKQ